MTPEYLLSLAPLTVCSNLDIDYAKSDLQTIPAKSQLYYNSFLSSVTQASNRLTDETKVSPSITSFKHKLNSDIEKPPK